ncbi:MAG: MmcQ/YjbR family DNA-binding protein [Saprospiraceae bacterium]|nr:MmcQ/YjbR family DNA-binding protein [Saprospiraceae bacterium]
MNIEEYRDYCLSKKGVEETTPFGPDTLVFKVMGKMFSATGMDEEEFRINVKCDPERAIELRASHPDIIPGWHMNKKHWNTIYCERGLRDTLISDLIDHSYDLVVQSLKKMDRKALEDLPE